MLVTAVALAVLFVGLCVAVGYRGQATQFNAPERDYNEPFVQ